LRWDSKANNDDFQIYTDKWTIALRLCCGDNRNASLASPGPLALGSSPRRLRQFACQHQQWLSQLNCPRSLQQDPRMGHRSARVQRSLCSQVRLRWRIPQLYLVSVSLFSSSGKDECLPHVFSKHLAVSTESKNNASALGLIASPFSEQSKSVQNVGTITIFAPCEISSLHASGKAKSQQISIPTFPSGVSKTGCSSIAEEVRWSRSIAPQRFFFT